MELADRTATWVLAETEAGRLTRGDYLEACLSRIAAREPEVKAWACLEADVARKAAAPGPLSGLPIGVKDVFDTADWPTGCGSPLYAGHRPGHDAAAVALARAAGCVLPGKTVTTEFAYFYPGPTANPHNPAHTPGGSSSGSAAAVGAGMVPFALGTQTAGSVIRPAAFCGVVGYKPTFGTISTFGVKQFGWSLDTVGVFARDLADAALLAEVLSGLPLRPRGDAGAPRIGLYRAARWSVASDPMTAALEAAAAAARAAGAQVAEVELPEACDALFDDQKLVMAYEGARALAHERRCHRDALSAPLLELTDAGAQADPGDYLQARVRTRAARTALGALFAEVDVLLTPPAAGAAPRGLNATGDPAFNRAWTLLGQPCVTLPAGRDSSGLPLGLQLVGGFDDDARLLAAATWLERVLAG
ncbi:amidase [Algihabitans albus]|uniref:amidase n=1 Tax=Algihabitans albus TaxID=2164067 RepID=UPI000E5D6B75|nr:amidase [Algihabitans albus]